MSDNNSPKPPVQSDQGAQIPRSALERVLARATELQTHGGEITESISESRLLEIGREVGIDPDHLRLALAEERSRSPMLAEEPGRIDRSLGEAHSFAQRSVPGNAESILAHLDRIMQREEQFTVKRHFGSRMSWEQKRSAFASIARSLKSANADLSRTDEVSATVTSVDGERSLVRLDADLRMYRKTQRDGAMALVIVNAIVAAGWMIPLTIFSATAVPASNLAPLAIAGAAATALQVGVSSLIWGGIKRAFKASVARTQLRLEQLLDALEHGSSAGSQPTLLEQLRQTLIPPGILPPGR